MVKKIKYEKRAECPYVLVQLIDLVNFLPDNPGEVAAELYELLGDWSLNERRLSLDDEIEFLVGSSITSYITNQLPCNSNFSLLDLYNPFMDLLRAKKLLDSIANANNDSIIPEHQRMENAPKKARERQRLFWFQTFLTIELGIKLDSKGFVDPSNDPILNKLTKIELNRIRRCAICEQIFWAKKTNAETCSLKCATDLSNRKRSIDRAEKKARRIAEEQQRKEARSAWNNRDFNNIED